MKSFSGEIKSVKMDLRACAVSIIAEEGTGLKGIEYTGDKKLEPDAEREKIAELVRQGRKIEAIKEAREYTGEGLRIAKDLVDRYF